MSIASNLSLRITALLLGGFVALQLVIFAITALPSRGDERRPYNLPRPEQAAVIADTLDRTPLPARQTLADTFNGSLYTVRLAPALPPPNAGGGEELQMLRADYAQAMPGRVILIDGRRARLGRLLGSAERPARFFAPVSVAIRLRDGSALLLTSQPSPVIRTFLRGRAAIGAISGLVVLGALMLAIRQTTRPLVRLARGVRDFGTTLDAPDLPVSGPREVRELSQAFNDMKSRLRELMGERTRILAAIAHDMRTYLTRLRLRAEYIEDAQHRERAARDLDEMTALLNDTLFFAGQDAGAHPPPLRLDLAAEVAATVETRRELGDAVTHRGTEPLPVRATPLAVRRIVGNLIDNGLRHGSAVTVQTRVADGEAELVIEDDGPGVPEAALTRLGEPFGRIEPSRNRDAGGAGLGLAIVRALALRDGALLAFANRCEGGLRVTLRYPLA